jgi:hypothetical protein
LRDAPEAAEIIVLSESFTHQTQSKSLPTPRQIASWLSPNCASALGKQLQDFFRDDDSTVTPLWNLLSADHPAVSPPTCRLSDFSYLRWLDPGESITQIAPQEKITITLFAAEILSRAPPSLPDTLLDRLQLAATSRLFQ